jgi:hypothetical protein
MPNLTQTEKVAREVPLDPIPGHSLVIYQRLGEGKVYFTELSPEQQFKEEKTTWWKRFTSNPPSYIAYAVNLNKHLAWKFTRRVQLLQNQTKSFDLIVTFEYHVSLPRRVAERYEDDPLGLLENEIFRLVNEVIATKDWDAIRNRFAVAARETIDCTKDAIDERAENLGFQVERLILENQLLEKDVHIEILREEAWVQQEANKIQHQSKEHEAQLEHNRKIEAQKRQNTERTQELDLTINRSDRENWVRDDERMNKLKDGGVEAGIKAMYGVGDEIKTPRQFKEVIDMVQGVSARRREQTPGGFADRALGGAAQQGYLPERTGENSGLPKVIDLLYRTHCVVEALDCPASEKNRLLSALFHLTAEALMGDEADEAKIKDYNERIKDAFVGLSHSPQDLERFLLDNFRSLKDRLK